MKLKIQNLGYIKSGEFETNKLTIIFGKNNSGKTYLSHTAYILSKEIKQAFSILCKSEIDFKKTLSEGDGATTIKISDIIDKKSFSAVNMVGTANLAEHFALPKSFFSKTSIKFDLDYLYENAIKSSFDFSLSSRFTDKIFIKKEKESDIINIIAMPNEDNLAHRFSEGLDSITDYFYKYQISAYICEEVFDMDIKNPFIITSERTGIELFYKEIDNNRSDIAEELAITKITTRKKLKNINEIVDDRIATYSMPISDNIKAIRNQYEIRKRTSQLSENKNYIHVINSLRKITNGAFISDEKGNSSFVMDASKTVEIPIHAASSSIKSMSLIDLYINHLAKSGETLIIDEPELNLHPDNQVLMAELIIRLVNSGVKVIITTHSDYLIREINNRIRLFSSDKSSPQYKELVETSLDCISHKDTNVYCILPSGTIEKVDVNKNGIESVIFDDLIISSSEREDAIISILGEQ
ncbi:TPA: AAA family ATPase [Citrobacter freundii]|nr:AAA family ATPase [Citrobacter freundii]